MKIKLAALDHRLLKIIRQLGGLADQRGVSLYLVGGFVRDVILKRKNLDLDFVVVGDAIDLARHVARKYRAEMVIHPRFNTATLNYKNGLRVDLAMARAENYIKPGVLPEVRPGTIHDDFFRRDFTINAMAISVNNGTFGELIDIYNGMQDIHNKKIRILHDQSFIDDPTRILRAVRFEQRFGFSLENQTSLAVQTALQRRVCRQITAQRFFHEFRKILKEPRPVKYLKRLYRLGALNDLVVLFGPDFRLLEKIEKNISYLASTDLYQTQDWSFIYILGMGEMLTSNRLKFFSKFDLTRRETESLKALKHIKGIIKTLSRKALRPSEVYLCLKPLPLDVVCYLRVRSASLVVARYVDRFLKEWRFIQLAINGHDLKKMGIACDQSMGLVLKELIKRKVDGHLESPQEEIRCAQKLAFKLKKTTH